MGSLPAKSAHCAENGRITAQCRVIEAHSQYVGSDAVDTSLSGSSVALAVGNPLYGSSASSAAAQSLSNWAEL